MKLQRVDQYVCSALVTMEELALIEEALLRTIEGLRPDEVLYSIELDVVRVQIQQFLQREEKDGR